MFVFVTENVNENDTYFFFSQYIPQITLALLFGGWLQRWMFKPVYTAELAL